MLFQELSLEQHSKNYTALTSQQFEKKFKTEEELGSGTFGSVYRVISAEGQELAIKQFNKDAMKNVKQIIREVDNLKRLQNPNIVRFFECYVVDKRYFRILLQYCEGGNLGKYIQGNKLTQVDLLRLVLDIAEGLAYAHQHKIVHRDLKPQNIFVGKANKAKIGDFGCSILMENELEPMMSRVGSPAYMDQRITDGNPYDISVDIYAFGLIIFCIYKGKGLYEECHSNYSLQRRKSSIYKDYDQTMEQLTEDLPLIIKTIIKNCLQTDFTQRYSARKITELIEKQISQKLKQKDLATKSTQEQGEIEDQNSILTMEIMKYMRDLEKQQKKSATQRKIKELLFTYKQKMEASLGLETLKYVDPRTKQKFIAFLYFYYIFWLKRMEEFLSGTNMLFQYKYNQIDPEDIDQDLMEILKQQINQQRRKYWFFFSKCCRDINPKLRLINQPLPNDFKEMIKMVCADNIKFDDFQDGVIREEVYQFFTNEVKREYNQNRGSDTSDEEKLKKIQDLCKNL